MIETPDPRCVGFLLHGADPSAVAVRRDRLVAALLGEPADDLRLIRLDAAVARRDPAELFDSLRVASFFGGRRIVVLADATDGMTGLISDALEGLSTADAALVVSAGALAARSSLRKLFETNDRLAALAIYSDPPSEDEIADTLRRHGSPPPDPVAMADLKALGATLDAGEFQKLLEKLALYMTGADGPTGAADVAACAPFATDAAVEGPVAAAAEGRLADLAAGLVRLAGQGAAPSTLSIAAARHFRLLHALKTADGGEESAVGRMRPPVWGPRQQALLSRARRWSVRNLEQALRMLAGLELELRSSGGAPASALVERVLVRIALLGQRRD